MLQRERLHTMTRVRLRDSEANGGGGVRVRIKSDKRHGNVPIIDLEPNECKWPTATVNTAQGPQHLFCGRPTSDTKIYCLFHHGHAYVKPAPRGGQKQRPNSY